MNDLTDYQKYRGKCKEFSQEAVLRDPTLRLVRGFYHCPFWGEQPHWWTVRLDGSIYDPTKDQFPSKGLGNYEEFTGPYRDWETDRKSTRLNSSHITRSRMPSSA